MSEARKNEQNIGRMIASVYFRTANWEEFSQAIEKYPYLKDEKLTPEMLFVLCNLVWHNGYGEGLAELER